MWTGELGGLHCLLPDTILHGKELLRVCYYLSCLAVFNTIINISVILNNFETFHITNTPLIMLQKWWMLLRYFIWYWSLALALCCTMWHFGVNKNEKKFILLQMSKCVNIWEDMVTQFSLVLTALNLTFLGQRSSLRQCMNKHTVRPAHWEPLELRYQWRLWVVVQFLVNQFRRKATSMRLVDAYMRMRTGSSLV